MKNWKKDEPNLTVTIGLDSSKSVIQRVFRKKVFWGGAVHLTRWVSGLNERKVSDDVRVPTAKIFQRGNLY